MYDADGKLLAYYRATIGGKHEPLPIGDWKILGVASNPVLHYNAALFWNAQHPKEKRKLHRVRETPWALCGLIFPKSTTAFTVLRIPQRSATLCRTASSG